MKGRRPSQDPDELALIIEQSWWNHLANYRFLEHSEFIEEEDLSWVRSGLEPIVTNNIYRARLEEEGLDGRIEAVLSPFQAQKVPVTWWLGPSCRPRSLSRRFIKHGLVLHHFLVGMWMDLSRIQGRRPAPPDLEIREVREERDLALLFRTIGLSFDFNRDSFWNHITRLYQALGYGQGTRWRHLIGLLEGRVAATASLKLDDQAATLINVGVLPEKRRRGLGLALTFGAVDLALQEGQRLMVLQSTLPGRPLYQMLGFEPACLLSAYCPAPPKGKQASAR